ncbi:MAG: HEAT repeat domain-containing protein, partial [Pyrinomonadaceae bacterium]
GGTVVVRKANARAAYLKHGYLTDAVQQLRIAETVEGRSRAASALGLARDRSATPHLIAGLADESAEVRRTCVSALAQLKDPSAVEPLRALYGRDSTPGMPKLIGKAIEACLSGLRDEEFALEPPLRLKPRSAREREQASPPQFEPSQSESAGVGMTASSVALANGVSEQSDVLGLAELATERYAPGQSEFEVDGDGLDAAAASALTDESLREICAAFDDERPEVRNGAANALYVVSRSDPAALKRAIEGTSPERRRRMGLAIATAGVAEDAITRLTNGNQGESYGAFSILFLMATAGEFGPLVHAVENHPNMAARLAVVNLLALCGSPAALQALRQTTARTGLPPEVQVALIDALFQLNSRG